MKTARDLYDPSKEAWENLEIQRKYFIDQLNAQREREQLKKEIIDSISISIQSDIKEKLEELFATFK